MTAVARRSPRLLGGDVHVFETEVMSVKWVCVGGQRSVEEHGAADIFCLGVLNSRVCQKCKYRLSQAGDDAW